MNSNQLTLFPEDSIASPSVSLEGNSRNLTQGGCGLSSPELYAVFIPDTSSLRMFPDFCPQAELDQSIAAYAAGLVDGDGSIWIQKGRKKQLYPAVSIRLGWKGRDTLAWLHSVFGGMIGQERRPPNPSHAEVYRWAAVGRFATAFLKVVYPFLRIKKAQAALALHSWSIWQQKSPGRFTTCFRLKLTMSLLNKTGPEVALPVVGNWLIIPTGSEEKPSLKWSETWPSSGTVVNGRAYRLPPLVPRTCVTGSSLWAIPTASDAGGRGWSTTQGRSLVREVKASLGLIPTPKASDSKGTRQQTANRRRIPPTGVHGGMTLTDYVTLYPTPTASDATGGPAYSRPPGRQGSLTLKEITPGALNPTWVEWLLGFPLGWTVV